MSDLDIKRLKREAAKALQQAVRAEGASITIRHGLGERIDGVETIKNVGIGTAKNLVLSNVKRALCRQGLGIDAICKEEGPGRYDFVFKVQGKPTKIIIGLRFDF